MEGYHTQPSKSAAGGVAIYVSDKLDNFKRDALSNLHDEFESIWVEMKNKKRENFLCGCFYHHPNIDISNLMDYLQSTFSNVNQKKYQVFFLGDFNIDLLQYESHSYTNDILNTMISNSFLPYIHQPIRVTDHSETVIDNIFSNMTDYETLSGNITSLIADHFAQFLLIKKCFSVSNLVTTMGMTVLNLVEKNLLMTSLYWTGLLSVTVNDHYDYFLEKTKTYIDSQLPKKKITTKH